MKVSELMAFLVKCDPDMEVVSGCAGISEWVTCIDLEPEVVEIDDPTLDTKRLVLAVMYSKHADGYETT